MPTHSMTCAHSCPPMLFKLRPCIQKLCNVHYPPTPSLGWIRQIKGRSLSLGSTRSASWLEYSLHSEVWLRFGAGWRDTQNPCPPMNNNIAPMPTQHPWVWVGMGMGTQCRAMESMHPEAIKDQSGGFSTEMIHAKERPNKFGWLGHAVNLDLWHEFSQPFGTSQIPTRIQC